MRAAIIEQLRHAEIKQLHQAVRSDQHVAWFQVPMHDQMLVRGGDCETDFNEQAQPLIDVEAD